jgi:signal recognition particle receptor subunit alpha
VLASNAQLSAALRCQAVRPPASAPADTTCPPLPQVPLYERGYEKDPAKVAFEAVKQAEREGLDVVLVDTAGR